MSAADNTSMRLVIMDRRRQVAALRLRGYTEREIQKGLAAPDKDGKASAFLNPKNGTPWSLGTIHKDIVALEAAWRADMVEKTDDHKARIFAELMEVARACWKSGDHDRVLKSLQQQRELLGTDAPKRVKGEFTGKDGAPLIPPPAASPFDLRNLTLEQLDQLEAIVVAGTVAADAAGNPEGKG